MIQVKKHTRTRKNGVTVVRKHMRKTLKKTVTKHSKRENKTKKKALYMENGKSILMEGVESPAAMKKGRQYPLSHEAIKKVSQNKTRKK